MLVRAGNQRGRGHGEKEKHQRVHISVGEDPSAPLTHGPWLCSSILIRKTDPTPSMSAKKQENVTTMISVGDVGHTEKKNESQFHSSVNHPCSLRRTPLPGGSSVGDVPSKKELRILSER